MMQARKDIGHSIKFLYALSSRIVAYVFSLCYINIFLVTFFPLKFHCQQVKDCALYILLVKLIGYLKWQCLYDFHQSGWRVLPPLSFIRIYLELLSFAGDIRLKWILRTLSPHALSPGCTQSKPNTDMFL